MSMLNRVGVVVVAILMVLSVTGANAAFAVNRTLLNSGHVTETFEKEGVYGSVATEGQDRISEELNETLENKTDDVPAGISINIDSQAAAEEALTEEYVAEEFSTIVEQMLSYLKGDAENLSIQVNLVPVKDSLGEYLENDTVTVDTVALANEQGINVTTAGVKVDSDMIERLNTNQSGYESVRQQLRSQAVEGADLPVLVGADGSIVVEMETFLQQTDFEGERNNVTVDTAILVRMNANQSGYADARADIRSQALQQSGIPVEVAENGSVEVDTVKISREINFESGQERVSIDDGMIARLNANQSGYEDVRVEIRAQAVETFPVDVDENGEVVVDTADIVQEIDFDTASDRIDVTDDMLVQLNDGPDGYTAVRSEIRDQVRSQLPSGATSSQIDTALEEINAELKKSATSQARAKYGENVSEETLGRIIALQNTVIDGLTDPELNDYNAYASQRDDEEVALADSFDHELNAVLREANEEIKTNSAQQARERYGDTVSNGTLSDVIALQNTVIDGLTNPDLTDFDEYTTRRNADEAALEESLTVELEDQLREVNEAIEAEAAEQVRSEYGDNVDEETITDIVGLQKTVIDGLTDPDLTEYEDYTSQRDDAKAALEDSLDQELSNKLREAGADVKADAADRIRNEYADQVSEDTIEDVVALQNVVVDGLTQPKLTYNNYTTQRDDAEAAVESSLGAELNERVDDQVDDQIELGNATGEQADSLNTVRAGVGLFGTLRFVLPLVFLALVGVVYVITRSIHRMVTTAGYSLVVAGLMGAVVGILMTGPALNGVDTALEPSAEELGETGVIEAIQSLVEGLFSALLMQSVLLATVGIVLVGIVIADKRDLFERFSSPGPQD